MDLKQKILIVEDEPEIAELIRMHMDRNGFQTSIVHSGKAGIDEIARSMPDCVLLDLMLPDLDGRRDQGASNQEAHSQACFGQFRQCRLSRSAR